MRKACACCGRVHGLWEWYGLDLVGVLYFAEDPPLELRQCGCENTLTYLTIEEEEDGEPKPESRPE